MSVEPVLRIAIDAPLNRCFDYRPPAGIAAERLLPGQRLSVPFGRGRRIGWLVELAADSGLPRARLKRAIALLDDEPVFAPKLFELLRRAARYYHHPPGEVFAAALPAAIRAGAALNETETHWRLTASGRSQDPAALARRAPRRAALLGVLAAHPDGAGAAELEDAGTQWRRTATALVSLGWLETVERPARRCAPPSGTGHETPPTLNAEQQHAADQILAHPGGFAAWLLDGVTGSGKTEVYLRVIAAMLEQRRQTLVLVPEISLTPQLVDRFRRRFAVPIAVVHSALGETERLDAWRAAREGRAAVVIGTRSAVFVPLSRPGLIVVDEEHDASFKQQEGFRYSARDLAVLRASIDDIPVVLGSATPSLESLANAERGRYRRLGLAQRPGAARLPQLRLIDLRAHAMEQGLSSPLLAAIQRNLGAGGQVLLFLNRRGYAPTLFCPACGWLAECQRCDARLTCHRGSASLRCHHCGHERPLPQHCPDCAEPVKPVGQGTERIEEVLAQHFPHIALARVDRDAMRRRGRLQSVLEDVRAQRVRILVGTQMLTKGHDFPGVSLVGVLNADQGLFGTDYRASELVAQTIVQVAGRAGRAERPGEVLIQTEFPQHPLLGQLIEHGYGGFAAAALAERAAAGWPPFSRLAILRAEAVDRGRPFAFLESARAQAQTLGPGQVRLLGPAAASMERRAGRYRAQLLLQSADRTALQRLLDAWHPTLETLPQARRVRWSLDVDPLELF